MTHEHTPKCEELQEALRELRAQMVPPQRETAMPGFQAAVVVDTGDRTPSVSPEAEEQINNLTQQLRDMGCDREDG